jgi:hypothetical protein
LKFEGLLKGGIITKRKKIGSKTQGSGAEVGAGHNSHPCRADITFLSDSLSP